MTIFLSVDGKFEVLEANKKQEILDYIALNMDGLQSEDRVCISIERQSYFEHFLDQLVREGCVI